MPLILMTGIPSSGKSERAKQIKNVFENEFEKNVHIVSENELIISFKYDKKEVYFDPQKEKEIRSVLKSQVLRCLNQDEVVILDSGNYIKGYRYELYCASKGCKTTQATVECLASTDIAWQWNIGRDEAERYSREAFDALVQRHEMPDSRNRWDTPLIPLQPSDSCPAASLYAALFDRKPPPPNQATQSAPLSSTSFLYELDRITKEIVTAILSAKKLGQEGVDIPVPGFKGCSLDLLDSRVTPAQLARYRRQFLNYAKLNPPASQLDLPQTTAELFVQFLNTNLKGTS